MARAGTNHKGGQKAGTVRPKITDYWSQDEISEYFNWLKTEYKTQPTLAKFVGEQLMGKPVQPIGNDGDEPFKIQGVEIRVRN